MNEPLSLAETLAAVPPLTRARLETWVAAEIVRPLPTPQGPAFRRLDVARLTLACELTEEFELAEEGLALVLGLIDRLQRAEAELSALAAALAAEEEPVRRRIGRLVLDVARAGG